MSLFNLKDPLSNGDDHHLGDFDSGNSQFYGHSTSEPGYPGQDHPSSGFGFPNYAQQTASGPRNNSSLVGGLVSRKKEIQPVSNK